MASSDQNEELDSTIKELKRYLDELVLEDGEGAAAKGAVVVIDQGGEIKFASAFPRSEKLVYANVGFESSDGNKYFEYEGDEVDEKQVTEEVEDEIKSLSKTDLMIKEMIDGCKYENLTKSAIQVLQSRASKLTSEQLDELFNLSNKKKTEEKIEEKTEDDDDHED